MVGCSLRSSLLHSELEDRLNHMRPYLKIEEENSVISDMTGPFNTLPWKGEGLVGPLPPTRIYEQLTGEGEHSLQWCSHW